jgi:membrane protein insertase Oxa1/YidC/SpoIIIJ
VDNFEFLLATALLAGLLISVHCGIADDLILYPAYVLLRPAASHPLLQWLWIVILTPAPFYLFLVNATPYSVVLPVLLVALFFAQTALVPKRALAPNPQAAFDGQPAH